MEGIKFCRWHKTPYSHAADMLKTGNLHGWQPERNWTIPCPGTRKRTTNSTLAHISLLIYNCHTNYNFAIHWVECKSLTLPWARSVINTSCLTLSDKDNFISSNKFLIIHQSRQQETLHLYSLIFEDINLLVNVVQKKSCLKVSVHIKTDICW